MSSAKGLNSTESNNRFRFEKLSERLSRVNVDVVHKVQQSGALGATIPDSGSEGCYFQDELEQCKDLDLTSHFKRFYYDVWPLVQSLPELLHNLPILSKKIKEAMKTCPLESLSSFLQLLSVLARDIQDEIFEHISDFFSILISLVDKASMCGSNEKIATGSRLVDPELTGKIFECMSHLIRSICFPLSPPQFTFFASDFQLQGLFKNQTACASIMEHCWVIEHSLFVILLRKHFQLCCVS